MSFYDFTNYLIGKAKSQHTGQLLELPFITLENNRDGTARKKVRHTLVLVFTVGTAAVAVLLITVWSEPGRNSVFLFFLSKSTHVEEERSATHNSPSGDGEYKNGGQTEKTNILRFYQLYNR